MNATRVRITKVNGNRGERIVSLLAVFLLGGALGSGFVLYQNGKLMLPSINPRTQLGTAALSEGTGETSSNSVDTISDRASSEVTPAAQTITTAPTETSRTDAEVQKRELLLRINDRTIAIERLNQEIERTKNASVAIIASFEQNCGSWSDACALPYASKLDASNKTYNELIGTLTALSSELDVLKQELGTLN